MTNWINPVQRRAVDRRRREQNQTLRDRQWIKLIRRLRAMALDDVRARKIKFPKPRPGDLVVEATSFRRDPDGLGVLLGRGYDEHGQDTFAVQPLRLLPEQWVHSWRNSDWYVVPPRGRAIAAAYLGPAAAKYLAVGSPLWAPAGTVTVSRSGELRIPVEANTTYQVTIGIDPASTATFTRRRHWNELAGDFLFIGGTAHGEVRYVEHPETIHYVLQPMPPLSYTEIINEPTTTALDRGVDRYRLERFLMPVTDRGGLSSEEGPQLACWAMVLCSGPPIGGVPSFARALLARDSAQRAELLRRFTRYAAR